MIADIEYRVSDCGNFATITMCAPGAEDIWRQIVAGTIAQSGVILSRHIPALRRDLAKAGWTIRKAPPPKKGKIKLTAEEMAEDQELLESLGL